MLGITLLLALISIFSLITYYSYKRDILPVSLVGSIIIVMLILFLIAHISEMSLKSYKYNVWIAKRNSFEQTLNDARKNSRDIEILSISRDIAKWNEDLAIIHVDLNHWFLHQYIDERFKNIKPIK